MPAWTMTDFNPRDYPAQRDAYGVPLGTVRPGDVIERDEAPDQYWAPYDGAPPTGSDTPETDTAGETEGDTSNE